MTGFYIDWSKAPEGTTHAYVDSDIKWIDGIPVNPDQVWEKHTGQVIFEWRMIDEGWATYQKVPMNELQEESRVVRPSPRLGTIPPPELSQIQELTKRVEELEAIHDKMYQALLEGKS